MEIKPFALLLLMAHGSVVGIADDPFPTKPECEQAGTDIVAANPSLPWDRVPYRCVTKDDDLSEFFVGKD